VPVLPPGSTRLGFSFRLPQAERMGLEPRVLGELLGLGFDVVRLAALWDRLEPRPGAFDPSSLDWQVEAAVRSGTEVILALGPVKNFGYPEFYVPGHHLPAPLREGSLVTAGSRPELAEASLAVLSRLVERYRGVSAITAWQVEHEALDPLGLEHSWRLGAGFVSAEVDLVRQLDPGRPILLNGFVPMSIPVALQQRWRTRGQGDSLGLAWSLADIVGLDVYPCHALAGMAGVSLYLDASDGAIPDRLMSAISSARRAGRRVMVSEGQAEPWEAVTNPPNPPGRVAASCPPERLITTYNACLAAASDAGTDLAAYLFWGTEYWLLRHRNGDPSYVSAFERVRAYG
jgi:hypothetical protein